ncbi:MAG: recombinase family protein [Armatimonadetes bacterium]|nr:recombinase family protein [Armatimonadota bacterium]
MKTGVSNAVDKIDASHLDRAAYVYVRQSSLGQVEKHKEGRLRQYQLANWTAEAGWPGENTVILDDDQGKSGASPNARSGFSKLVSAVGRGEVGIVVALDVMRLARNSPDWHNLIFMCRWTDTLIADGETIYDPSQSNDRMILGVRSQLGELELDHSIERMVLGRWNKAGRGEMMTVPPAGYEIDDAGQLVKANDEAVAHSIARVFEKFDELGSARQVFLWWIREGVKFPVRRVELRTHPVVWLDPLYAMFWRTLRNPIYAGAYVFGRSELVRRLDEQDPTRLKRARKVREDWPILIREHHEGYISFDKYLENRKKLRDNAMMTNSPKDGPRGPAREGPALLQGLVRCGRCGRAMTISYGGNRRGKTHRVYQYRCWGKRKRHLGTDCQVIGGKRIDRTVVEAFLEATRPASLEAAKEANRLVCREHEQMQKYWQQRVEKAEYEAQRAQRQYEAVEPENRLVARTLEKRWNERLVELEEARAKAVEEERKQPALTEEELARVTVLVGDLEEVWNAKTTEDRDRKRLLRCLIEEVQLRREEKLYRVLIIWKGGATTEREVERRSGGQARRTPEDTVDLVKKLAGEFDDAQIARILNKQGRRTGNDNPFSKAKIVSLRGKHRIPKCPKKQVKDPREGPFTADEAAVELGVCLSTVFRWLREGVLAGEQATPGAPWRIVLTDEVRRRLMGGEVPEGWVGLTEASRRLGLTKSHVSYLVKTGKLNAVRVTVGKRSCWRIDLSSTSYDEQPGLFDQMATEKSRGV